MFIHGRSVFSGYATGEFGATGTIEGDVWRTYTATLTSAGGNLNDATISKSTIYRWINENTILVNFDITLTNIGSGSPAGALIATLPALPARAAGGYGFEAAVAGVGLSGFVATGDKAYIRKSDGTSVFTNGARVYWSATYEV